MPRTLFFLTLLLLIVGLSACADKKPIAQAPSEEVSPEQAADSGEGDGGTSEAGDKGMTNFVEIHGKRYRVTGGAAPGFIDDKACEICHADLFESYQDVAMSKAFYKVSDDNVIEDFENGHFYHEASGRHYDMKHRDGKYFVSRYCLDEDSEKYAELEVQVDWIIGSGNHARGYLTQTDRGELFQLPVAWYSQEGRWGIAPGFEFESQSGFTRQISRDCMFCHTAYPDVPAGSDAYRQPEIFPSDLPDGIGCQRCHGPGAAHVRVASNPDSTLKQARMTIVNPEKLDKKRSSSVCYQCHLQPTSGFRTNVVRFDRGVYSFVAGEDLEDHMVVLDYDTEVPSADRFEVNHHPYRMHQSRCYTKSGKMTCLTCHNPHRKVPQSEQKAHYKKACLGCHTIDKCSVEQMVKTSGEIAAQLSDLDPDDCVTCHMHRRRPSDTPQVITTDHKITRELPDPNFRDPLPPTKVKPFHNVHLYAPEKLRSKEEEVLYIAIGALLSEDPRSLRSLQELLRLSDPKDDEPLAILALGLIRAGAPAQGESVLKALLKRNPELGMVHRNLGVIAHRNNDLTSAEKHLRKALQIDPSDPFSLKDLGRVLARQKKIDEAVAVMRRAVAARPSFVAARLDLGMTLARLKDVEGAAAQFKAAVAWDPGSGDAYLQLGRLLASRGRRAEAIRWYRRGRHLNPTIFPEICLLYLTGPEKNEKEGFKAALALAEEFIENRPPHPDARVLLALLYARRGDHALASGVMQQSTKASNPAIYQLVRAVLDYAFEKTDKTRATLEKSLGGASQPRTWNALHDLATRQARSLLGR